MTTSVSNACSPRRLGSIDDDGSQPTDPNAKSSTSSVEPRIRSLDIEGQVSFVSKTPSAPIPRLDRLIAGKDMTPNSKPRSSFDSTHMPNLGVLLQSKSKLAADLYLHSIDKPDAHSRIVMLATQLGQPLSKCIENEEELDSQEVKQLADTYIKYTQERSSDPKYKTLHDNAVATKESLVNQREARDYAGKLALEQTTRLMKTSVPLVIQPRLVISELPVVKQLLAQLTPQLLDTLKHMIPLIGPIGRGIEAITGKKDFGRGDPMLQGDRIKNGIIAVVSLIMFASRVLSASAQASTKVVDDIANRTDYSASEIESTLRTLNSLPIEPNTVLNAMNKYKAGEPLSANEKNMLGRAVSLASMATS